MARSLVPYLLFGSALGGLSSNPAVADLQRGPVLVVSRIQYVTGHHPAA
jgi:hypothetical protein